MSGFSGDKARTDAIQRRASDPAISSFVAANAGSGKTHVLTMRVIRLLLNGVQPDKILCLTFTKLAAANMATRIFNILAQWTQLSDADLRIKIEELGEAPPDAARLARARRLFAEAVETPGGLKIQTIHAFCERLLHLFPFEANVPAGFRVVQDQEQAQLFSEARQDVLRAEDMHIRAALTCIVPRSSEGQFGKLLSDALARRDKFAAMSAFYPEATLTAGFAAALGLAGGETVAGLEAEMLAQGFSQDEMLALAARLGKSGPSEFLIKAAQAQRMTSDHTLHLDAYLDVFFTATGTPKQKGWLTKDQGLNHPDIATQMENERGRLFALREKARAAQILEQSLALAQLVNAVLRRYADLKVQRSVLDFDDLIERSRRLLGGAGREWVLFKLDQGIDHILVDEAQDTSPAQWDIFRALVEEFFAGEGRSRQTRTVFAVGDEKQSIYSFQGAQPQLFEANRAYVAAKASAARKVFDPQKLYLSFRSSPIVLAAVDAVFKQDNHLKGMSFGDGYQPHSSLKLRLPGLVEVWPLYAKQEPPKTESWRLPVDHISENHPKVRLAKQIARTISGWLSPLSPERVADKSGMARPVRAGDILILVRNRSGIAEGLNRELKLAGVPVAGADRLKLASHIAVLDLIAAGRAALLPLDDLQVACTLKSPLFGFDDVDLLRLAPKRSGTLIGALAASVQERDRAAAARFRLWAELAQSLSPFQFYMRILAKEGGRKAILARLGQEAADVLDEFLSAALSHEAAEAPSLVNFLCALENSDIEIKRDFDAAGDSVRVMTVHSAKGLEAKIVILADTGAVPNGSKDAKFFEILPPGATPLQPPLIVWSPRKDADCAPVAQARQRQLELAHEEHRRLLYVAMTRAEERLYICGHHAAPAAGKEPDPLSWYQMVKNVLPDAETLPVPWLEGQFLLRRSGNLLSGPVEAEGVKPEAPLPDWLFTPLPAEQPAQPPLRPSNLMSAAHEDEVVRSPYSSSRLAGQMIHRLLQLLPGFVSAQRRVAAQELLRREAPQLDAEQAGALLASTEAVLAMPELAAIFSLQARAEVEICGEVTSPDGRSWPIVGRMDRMVVNGGRIELVDFKTGVSQKDALNQVALYWALLRQIYPDKEIRIGIVWTQRLEVEWLDEAALQSALYALFTEGAIAELGVNSSPA